MTKSLFATPPPDTGTIAFTGAGTFGYAWLNQHTLMHGGIWVD
ncbi:MAG: hypothetical protein ABI321_08540 [Polyangia bacterium]